MSNANLPPARVSFGIGKTLGQAWQNAFGSWAKVSARLGGAVHNPYDVHDALAQSHSALHEQMINQALTRAATGRTIQPAGLSPDVHGIAVNESGMTNVGQHVAPVPTSADRYSPVAHTLATNPFDVDRGSLMYSIPATGWTPERPSF